MRVGNRIRVSFAAIRLASANRELRLVQFARLWSVTGRWAYTVTLAVYAYRSGGAQGVALAGIVRLAPAAVAAPFAGVLISRLRLDVLLLTGGLLRTATLALAGTVVLSDGPSTLVYVLVAGESAVSTLLRPVQNSLLPALSRTPQELTSSNLALSVIESGGVFLGPLAGAALLSGTSIGAVFLAAALAYLISAAVLLPIRSAGHAAIGAPRRGGLLRDALLGARAVAEDSGTRMVVLIYGAQNLVAGTLNVLIVVAAIRLLDMGQSGVGALTAALGVGGVVGGMLVLGRLRKGRHGVDLWVGLMLWGLPLILMSLLSSRLAAFALLAVVGVGVTVVEVAAVTLLQRQAAGDLLPHALATVQTVFVIGLGAGTLIAPVLVDHLGIRGALAATGMLLPVLALLLSHRIRRLGDTVVGTGALVDLLTAIPIFAPLPEASIEHLAGALRPVELPEGHVVFAQGDHGDGFYVIESGRVDVEIDGRHVRQLGPGDSFGEIALLRDVPRTATVRASTAVCLQRLDRGRFLGTVTGDPRSADAADAIVGKRLGLRTGFTSV